MQSRTQHRLSSTYGSHITIDPFSIQPPKLPEKPIPPELRFKKKNFSIIRNENPNISVWEVSDILAKKWEEADDTEKMIYYQEYEREKMEYEKQMKSYYNSSAFQQYSMNRQKVKSQFERSLLPNVGNQRKFDAAANGGIVVQPLEEDNPRDLNIKKLTAIRYSRNQLLMAEVFAPNCLADVRHIVTKARLDLFKKQEAALKQAISENENEIAKMQENLENKKRQITKNREEFTTKMRKLIEDDKPRCSGGDFNIMVEKWKTKFLTAYEEFEKKQQAQKEKLEHEREARPTLNSLLLGENDTIKEKAPGTTEDKKESVGTKETTEIKSAEETKEVEVKEEVKESETTDEVKTSEPPKDEKEE
ncbi:SWI/SNF-related matrix-associated actin-dependent regulator of chromatin subfamily E member 1 [Strongyloides ratti]|uniref:SWI/SNF-related matrix-associated actin-dependent regulator of chromatin subfamily E member 1 n=1 Tax=Strongyloides ratti TaxID=34506 RepID=A0A090LIJ2_STRRB|nr:SWI/SNF-related matrix-associated actin-dependent regulator of chromatin subfamily E member 1 [Strongyloides ratti]CEF67305.1 SWI/SNF-related matrix-associated actin-dependent regulator of chromatin subfamily E member 1 [Strongyloides ratti]